MGWNQKFLLPGEKLLMQGFATRKNFSLAGGMAVGALLGASAGLSGGASTGAALSMTNGRLFLTDKRLVFAKHIFMLFGTKIVQEIQLYALDAVVDVEKDPYNYIRLDTKDGKSYLFDLAIGYKKDWLAKLNEALSAQKTTEGGSS